jgi:NAD-reducing hydrogenase large subunit
MSNLAPSLRDTGPQPPAQITRARDRAALRFHSVGQVARHFIHGNQMKKGMLNRVSAVVRVYDPCLSCSTHADGTLALEIALKGPGGEVLDRIG